MRHKEEAQRVVVHLRSLIDGQAHHMEHIIRSLSKGPELNDYVDDSVGVLVEDDEDDDDAADAETMASRAADEMGGSRKVTSRAHSRASTLDGKLLDSEAVRPDMERRLFNSPDGLRRRFSQQSFADVADRHLQDKTDAIADIIRNISEQCAAAVQGLHMAQTADEEDDDNDQQNDGGRVSKLDLSDDGHDESLGPSSDADEAETERDRGLLSPHGGSNSPYPPTPDLVHRSSTAMSVNSQSTTPERHSQQYTDLPTKIVEDDDEHAHEMEHAGAVAGAGAEADEHVGAVVDSLSKKPSASLIRRPAGARISALGQA